MSRSVNTEITLDAGKYSVLVKVTAYRRKSANSPEDVVRENASCRREKLVQIGLSYDLAHTKGLTMETEAEKRERAEREERHRFHERQKLRERTIEKLKQQHIREKKLQARRERMMERERQRRVASQFEFSPEEVTPDGKQELEDRDQRNRSSDQNIMELGINGNNNNGSSYYSGRPTSRNRSSRPPQPSLKTRLIIETNNTMQCNDDEMAELLEDFEFDSDLDMPPEHSPSPPFPSSSASFAGPSSPSSGAAGGEGQGSDSPWNAVCVVGLKVFSKDPLLQLQVVKPGCNGGEAPLDRDDPAVSATFEKKMSWCVKE